MRQFHTKYHLLQSLFCVFLFLLGIVACEPKNEDKASIKSKKVAEKKLAEPSKIAIKKPDSIQAILDAIEVLPDIKRLKDQLERQGRPPYKISILVEDEPDTYTVLVKAPDVRDYEFLVKVPEFKRIQIRNIHDRQMLPYVDWRDMLINQDWAKIQPLFPVYDFGGVMGLTFELESSLENEVISNLYASIKFVYEFSEDRQLNLSAENDSITKHQTTPRMTFWRSQYLTERLLQKELTFSIICERGVVQRIPKEAVINMVECKSKLVLLRLDEIDKTKYGYPIMAVLGEVDMKFENFPEIEKDIQQRDSSRYYEYMDRIAPRSIGSFKNYQLLIHDDFTWQLDKDSPYDFPGRLIYSDNQLFRSYGLDLFGITCD